jgi:hypothetical protein
MTRTPRQQGHFAGWSVGNALHFTGHAANPHTGAAADEWSAGYWDGFASGEQDHRDHMISTGRAA